MKHFLGVFFLVLSTSCSSLEKRGELKGDCFPVSFDHIWFRVANNTYKEMGESTYFGDNKLSFYEPNKSPWGTHYGHYVTGEYHHLEIFEEKMPTTPEPLGIGFLSEVEGCLAKIHETLNRNLPHQFDMKPEADWGRYTQLKESPEIAVWVSELKPAYVGNENSLIDRKTWLRRIREMNKDPYKGEYNFTKISEVSWNLPKSQAVQLTKIFLALGWLQKSEYSFEHDGTRVSFHVVEKNLKPRNYLNSVSLRLKNKEKGMLFDNFIVESRKSPPKLFMQTITK